MLIFKGLHFCSPCYFYCDLNTSHVDIQVFDLSFRFDFLKHLNTSHVDIQEVILITGEMEDTYLNTSHVDIQDKLGVTLSHYSKIFKYISC